MPRPTTRASHAEFELNEDNMEDQEIDIDAEEADTVETADDENAGSDDDPDGDDDSQVDPDGGDNVSPELEPSTGQWGKELEKMSKKQAEVMAALLEERAAISKDRADFNAERVKMVEFMHQSGGKSSRDHANPESSRARVGMAPGKSPKFNGETEWTAFYVQFETWMKLHGYDETKHEGSWSGLLGLAMEGEAQVFFSGLSAEERGDFLVLKSRLEQRYSGDGTAEVSKAKLQSMGKRQPGDSLSKLRDSMWLMTRKGYPNLPRSAQEQICLDALLRAVDSDLRVQCSMRDCTSVDQALGVMEKFEAIVQADSDRRRKPVKAIAEVVDPETGRTAESQQEQGLAGLCKEMVGLMAQQVEVLNDLKKGQGRSNYDGRRKPPPNLADVECFSCREKGHYSRSCPKKGVNERSGRAGNSSPPAGC